MCRWNKANVFIDASSYPSCHSGRDNFPAERRITDVPLMKCLWCQPPYCQEQWGWQDGHSPFHVLGCVSIIYAFTSGFIAQQVENGKTSQVRQDFLSLTETNNPLSPVFFPNANAPLGGPACFIGFDVHFWTSRRQRNYGCQTNAGSRSCNDAKWHDQAERPKNERVCHPRAVVCGLVDLSRKHKQHLLAASKLLPTQTTGCFLLVLKCLV